MDLVTDIYELTKDFPPDEKFGIVSQIRRAAISVPSNIAEGCARYSNKENLHFLDISMGSLAELETQIIISRNLGFIKNDEILQKIYPIKQMLSGLKRHIKQKDDSD